MKQLLYQGLIYSLDTSLTPGVLQSGNYPQNIPTETLERWLSTHDVKYVVQGMDTYQFKFSCIKSSPYIIYFGGDFSLLDKPLLAIVGPRLKSDYADKVLEKLFSILQHYDLVTISGMADGVDWYAHQLSMSHGIPTIGVLGAGLAYYRRSSYAPRYDQIVAAGGLVLSEFPLMMKSAHYTYPQRNRIIAGLADAVFLPEAAEESGSLITVDFAVMMNKPIGATPNSIFAPSSAGINAAMQHGRIQPVQDIEAFVSRYFQKKQGSSGSVSSQAHLTIFQQKIMNALTEAGEQGLALSQLCTLTKCSHGQILAELSLLEMEGVVKEDSGGRFVGVT